MDNEQYMKEQSFQLRNNLVYSSGVLVSANIEWSDGGLGVYTVTSFEPALKKVLAYNATHVTRSKRVSQATRILNSDGDLASQPALVVTDL